MNEETLKRYLIRDKPFLRELYEGTSKLKNNQVLYFASDSKLNTLIRFLHFLVNGVIKIKRENFEVIQKYRKLLLLKRNVEKKGDEKLLKF